MAEKKLTKEEEQAAIEFMKNIQKWQNRFHIVKFYAVYSLTRFFPFSDMFQDNMAHYKFKPARDLDGKIWKKFKIEIGSIADDGTFLHMFYPPGCMEIEKLQKFVEKEGAYANFSVEDMIEVKVSKEIKNE